jgi:hypothetical protein
VLLEMLNERTNLLRRIENDPAPDYGATEWPPRLADEGDITSVRALRLVVFSAGKSEFVDDESDEFEGKRRDGHGAEVGGIRSAERFLLDRVRGQPACKGQGRGGRGDERGERIVGAEA